VFKRQAAVIENALSKEGWSVSINAEKPRKGSFVVTVVGESKPAIELLELKRPFQKLRDIDLQAAVDAILSK
jgi:hypothetical protein